MTAPARVSIVTPFLNARRFLAEAIESVLAQTFVRWELLLVDDGSSDGSAAVAAEYAAMRPEQIRLCAHPGRDNRGASAARNLGIRHAAGEYLAFLDADDVYLPRKLEEQVRILDRVRDAQVLYAATEYWHSWTGVRSDGVRDWVWRPHGLAIDRVIDPPRALVAFLRDGGAVPCMGSVLARRDAVIAAGGWEESFRRICTDQVFHAKLTLRLPVLFSDGCWDRYRQHPDSSCQRAAAAGETAAAFETYLRWLERYLDAEHVSDASVRAALRKGLGPYDHPFLHRLERRVRRHSRKLGELFGKARRLSPLRPGRT